MRRLCERFWIMHVLQNMELRPQSVVFWRSGCQEVRRSGALGWAVEESGKVWGGQTKQFQHANGSAGNCSQQWTMPGRGRARNTRAVIRKSPRDTSSLVLNTHTLGACWVNARSGKNTEYACPRKRQFICTARVYCEGRVYRCSTWKDEVK